MQLLHINDCHWVTTSNVNVHGCACYPDTVCVYDSERPSTVHPDITRIVCSFFKCQSSQLRIDIMNVFMQPNCNDCGIYAIANATELACGADPVRCNWDVHIMRQHLIQCFENEVLTEFPKIGERCVRLGTRVHKSSTFSILCICRTINDPSKSMIECVRCLKWYHKVCEKRAVLQ